jgi:hypothetical protein
MTSVLSPAQASSPELISLLQGVQHQVKDLRQDILDGVHTILSMKASVALAGNDPAEVEEANMTILQFQRKMAIHAPFAVNLVGSFQSRKIYLDLYSLKPGVFPPQEVASVRAEIETLDSLLDSLDSLLAAMRIALSIRLITPEG